MEENFTQISEGWNIDSVKAYPKKEGLRISSKYIRPIAEKLATIYMNDTTEGKLLSKELKSVFALHFGMYVSYRMESFLKDAIEPLIVESFNKINGEVKESCSQEEDVCMPSLIKSYKDLYLPFYIMKFPIQKLGFGQFMSYFSRLVTKNEHGYFLSSNKVNSDEKLLEEYLVKVFDDITTEKNYKFNVSIFDLIRTYNFYKQPHAKESYAGYLMKKFGCGGDEQQKLNIRWINWCNEEDDAVLAQKCQEDSPPCENMTAASCNEYDSCCKVTNQLKDKLQPILKVMKYAAQPPHFMETDLEMNLTFQHAKFLNYPLAFPLPSTLDATWNNVYGDGVLNSNPKIPICRYSGTPSSPKITNCNLFYRSITNEGLGYTFNGPNFWALHSETPFSKLFSDIMYPKKGQDAKTTYIKEGLIDPYTDADIMFPETSGPSYGLSIVLDSVHLYSSSKENATFRAVKTPFKVSI